MPDPTISMRKQSEQLEKRVRAALAAAGHPKVTDQWEDAIRFVNDHESTSITELAADLSVSTQRCSKVVGAMYMAGYLSYNRDDADRRRILLCLTQQGSDALTTADNIRRQLHTQDGQPIPTTSATAEPTPA